MGSSFCILDSATSSLKDIFSIIEKALNTLPFIALLNVPLSNNTGSILIQWKAKAISINTLSLDQRDLSVSPKMSVSDVFPEVLCELF